jgi:lipoprotein-releasing system ATP-binding protein
MSAPIVSLHQVVKLFAIDTPHPQAVLSQVDFTLQPGETVALLGSSGSGKSTLLNLIGTLDQPTSGEVRLFGQDPTTLEEKALAQLRAEKIGFIFQLHHLLPQLTVLENVLLPTLALEKQPSIAETQARAEKLLERVGLAPHCHKRPAQLSGGERQRVAVVRALINQPQLLLADEPTGALDEAAAHSLVELLLELREETGVAILLVTHDATLAARMSRVVRLKQGHLV